ncbi:hypothetical protein HDU98_001971 [Podochytrium sp. JEL0797]|nr:hypothetical protein HDU98_001971 [Podochytrium sp. JEL0797]
MFTATATASPAGTDTFVDPLETSVLFDADETTSLCSTGTEAELFHGRCGNSQSGSADYLSVEDNEPEDVRTGINQINDCIQTIGMGKYQYRLFFLCGLGWFADNMWLQGVSVVIPAIRREFGLAEAEMGYGSFFVFLGMMVGATVWGVLSDVVGRKLGFRLTLLITAIFGFWAASATTFAQFYWRLFFLGTGVGGNLPVDGSIFLEFIPASHGHLMTLLSLFWPLGSIFTAMIAWQIIPNGTCPSDVELPCDLLGGQNWAWRSTLRILAVSTGVMVFARVFCVHMLESPKFLFGAGRVEEAEKVLKELAVANGYQGEIPKLSRQAGEAGVVVNGNGNGRKKSVKEVLQRWAREGKESIETGANLFKSLFEPGDVRKTTLLIFAIWSFMSLGYTMFNGFLPIFLGSMPDESAPPISVDDTYRNYFILSIMGVPGSIAGMYLIDTRMGRRGTMAAATFGTAFSLYLFTFSRTASFQLFCGCVIAVLQNTMYGVLYTYTPEVFESRVRGTANGAAAALSRVFGCMAPLLTGSLLAFSISTPLFVASASILVAAVCMVNLPFETRGRDVL